MAVYENEGMVSRRIWHTYRERQCNCLSHWVKFQMCSSNEYTGSAKFAPVENETLSKWSRQIKEVHFLAKARSWSPLNFKCLVSKKMCNLCF